jgi:hypothetical protein
VNEQNEDRFKPTWKDIHTIRVGDIRVTIRASDHRRPRYSFDIGFAMYDYQTGEERGITRHHSVRFEDGIKAKMQNSIADQIQQAVLVAESFITELVQKDTIDWRAQHDVEQANRGKPQTRHTGKTERHRERRVQREG